MGILEIGIIGIIDIIAIVIVANRNIAAVKLLFL